MRSTTDSKFVASTEEEVEAVEEPCLRGDLETIY